MHGIWGERLCRMEADSTKEGVHSIIAQTTITRSLHRLRNGGFHGRTGPRDDHALSVLRAYVSIFTEDTRVPKFLLSDSNHQDRTEYLLFFDGGSRGNPGPGGAGAVIVHINQNNHAASVTWAASMAYANKAITNNAAEYRGLLIGLRHAYNHALEPLHVIGDNAMVITQQRIRKSPTSPRLAALYQATKALANVLGVQSWSHHCREYNKMANCAANVTIDTHHSQQVKALSARSLIGQVLQHLHSDVEHWVTQTQDQFEQRNPTTWRPRSSPKEQATVIHGFRRRLGSMTPPTP